MQQKKIMPVGQNLAGSFGYLLARMVRRDRTDTVLKIVFLSLQLTDLTLTLVAAKYGYPELNPFMRASLGSLYKVAIIKFGVPFLISWIVPGRFLIPAIILLSAVVGWNVKELISLWMAF